jgi:suppressor for copper-sensitivity B
MLRLFNHLFYIIIIFFFTNAFAQQTNWSNGIESQVRIISPSTHINNQNELYLGLQYQLKKGWKTYWLSPGEGGFPQNIDWRKSRNIQNIEVLWPAPNEFEILGFKTLGYFDEVVFPLITTIQNVEEETSVVLDVNYLTCKDICIPGNAHLELLIPSGLGQITEHSFIIEKSLSLIPIDNLEISGLENVSVKASADSDNVSIIVAASSPKAFVDPKFYLNTKFGLPVITPKINYSANYKNLKANFVFERKLFTKNSFNLDVFLKNNNQAYKINADLNIDEEQSKLSQNNSLIHFLFIAFIGGLILNIMPCVLPVLSIKLLSILKKPEEGHLIRKSFIITSAGIVSSFILLALIFNILRLIGVNIGWGMQFQQPVFLIIIALILSLFALNLFGLFEFNAPSLVSSRIHQKIHQTNYFSDFFNGFFATILATPCSAPFVGTAITVAFTQSYFVMMEIFFCMGVGMAAPYLLVSLFPSIAMILPRPGQWMQRIKYLLGLLLLATLAWIGSILLNHFNVFFIITSSILLFLTSLILKFYKKKLLILMAASIIFLSLPNFSFFKFDQQIQDSDWVDLTTIQIDDYIQNYDILFVDITADWCAICQFNKINVINSLIIKEIFTKNNVIKIQGDWTKPNEKIEYFLQQHNKFGIPLNVMYSKSHPEGVVLSELLTINEIEKILDKIR